MCFSKKIKKLQQSVDELSQIVKTKELDRLRNESNELKAIKEMLSKIHIDVKSVRLLQDETSGNDVVKIKYNIPDLTLYFDSNGDVIKNEMFYSINMLNLISLDDMKKIKKVLNEKKTLDN